LGGLYLIQIVHRFRDALSAGKRRAADQATLAGPASMAAEAPVGLADENNRFADMAEHREHLSGNA
jgi:hypothetical protein